MKSFYYKLGLICLITWVLVGSMIYSNEIGTACGSGWSVGVRIWSFLNFLSELLLEPMGLEMPLYEIERYSTTLQAAGIGFEDGCRMSFSFKGFIWFLVFPVLLFFGVFFAFHQIMMSDNKKK